MELVVFYDNLLGQSDNCRHDAARRGKESLALALSLLHAADLYDGPFYLTIETAAQSLCHMSEVHVLVVHLT